MRNNNAMGILFSNMHDEALRDLTALPGAGFGSLWRPVPAY